MSDLINSLIEKGWLKTPRIIKAFQKISRNDFIPEGMKHFSEFDEPMPIGWDQTISQPLVAAFMLEQLKPMLGDKILDIGSGSGWTTALLAEIVGPKGKVIALEIIPELKEFGEKNAAKYNGITEFICADGSKGYNKEAPFDKILVSAAVQTKQIPVAWQEQLKTGGKIVAPIGSSIWLFEKTETEIKKTEHTGFAFVPLVEK